MFVHIDSGSGALVTEKNRSRMDVTCYFLSVTYDLQSAVIEEKIARPKMGRGTPFAFSGCRARGASTHLTPLDPLRSLPSVSGFGRWAEGRRINEPRPGGMLSKRRALYRIVRGET